MQTTTMLLWRNDTVIEAASAITLKRFDTSPNIGLMTVAAGLPYSLVGTTSVARIIFRMTLTQKLAKGVTQVRTNKDTKLKVNDILIIDSERIRVDVIDTIAEPGFYRLKVTRAMSGTTDVDHAENSQIKVLMIERSATLAVSASNNIVFMKWTSTNDTSRVGDFELEFEVTESTGAKFSIPTSPISIQIIDDFNGG